MRRRYLWIVALCGVMFGVLGSVGGGETVSVVDELQVDGAGMLVKTGQGYVLRSIHGQETKAFTKGEYKTPLVITAVVETDSQNLRLYYAKGIAIFNWELNESELRFHDPKTGVGTGFEGGGGVPKNTLVTVKWTIDETGSTISVGNVRARELEGRFLGIVGAGGCGNF